MLRAGVLLLTALSACAPNYVVERVPGRKAFISEAQALRFNDPFVLVPDPEAPIPEGRSYMLRVGEDVLGYIDVPRLNPFDSVTIWYVTFGDPGKCDKPYECGIIDFINPRVDPGFYSAGAGAFVDSNGRFQLTGLPITNGETDKLRLGSILRDALTGEVQMLLRIHGPPIAGLELEQITTWYGGCARTGDPRATYECHGEAYARHAPIAVYKTFASEGPMAEGEPRDIADVMLEGSSCIVAKSVELNVVMGMLDTSGLPPNEVISLSWYIFNAPQNCALGSGRCTIADAESSAVEASVIDQRGRVADAEGRLRAPLGPVRGGDFGVLRSGTGEVRSEAEILVVLRSHGVELTDRLEEQLSTYEGGCDVNGCSNVQFARILPE